MNVKRDLSFFLQRLRSFALCFTRPASVSLCLSCLFGSCGLCKPKASTQCVGPLPLLTDLWRRGSPSVPESSKLDERTRLTHNHNRAGANKQHRWTKLVQNGGVDGVTVTSQTCICTALCAVHTITALKFNKTPVNYQKYFLVNKSFLCMIQ